MIKNLVLSSSLLALAACASVVSGQTQTVTMTTPGAEHAMCRLNTGGNLYDAYTGQTIRVRRSPQNMIINCVASGNREKTVSMEWSGNEWGFLNVSNGVVPGVTYDILSGAAFEYPNELVVDFRDVPVRAYDLPEYHDRDLSEFNNGEYMGATTVGLPKDNRPPSDMPLKENTFENFQPAQEVAPVSGPVYERSNSIVPYDPKEEKK